MSGRILVCVLRLEWMGMYGVRKEWGVFMI